MRSTHLILGLSVSILTACGGGGGGGSSSTPPASVTPPPQNTARDDATTAAKTAYDTQLEENYNAAIAWLDENAQREGVRRSSTGLQFKINRNGGIVVIDTRPVRAVKVHFQGSLTDGYVFEETYSLGRPVEFDVEDLIEGWQEAIDLMSPGDEWTIYLPPELAYGAEGSGNSIPPNSAILFDITLIDKIY